MTFSIILKYFNIIKRTEITIFSKHQQRKYTCAIMFLLKVWRKNHEEYLFSAPW